MMMMNNGKTGETNDHNIQISPLVFWATAQVNLETFQCADNSTICTDSYKSPEFLLQAKFRNG